MLNPGGHNSRRKFAEQNSRKLSKSPRSTARAASGGRVAGTAHVIGPR